MNFNDFLKRIISATSIFIYGAGTMGRALKKCITDKPYMVDVQGFIVRSMVDNADIVEGLPVYDISNATQYKESLILIALNGKYIPEVEKQLTDSGFYNLFPISFDGDVWTDIRSNWIIENNIIPNKTIFLSKYSHECDWEETYDRMHIYVVHSIYDRKLSTILPEKRFEIPIQVGAALNDISMYPVKDTIGVDCISNKNRQYCEMTGIYWAWKNDNADYIGFSHYRRRFLINDSQFYKVISENIDIVVTIPIVNFDTVIKQYGKDHDENDWNVLIEAIKNISPEYYLSLKKVQNGIYYFAYNMFIMKREVFDRYCRFIFPILEYCEKRIGIKDDNYQNRYVGFLAERLLSIFIEGNSQYKVAIADKTFLE